MVLVTALLDIDSRIRGIDAGADDFLSKPFNQHELRARVRSLVRIKRFTSSRSTKLRATFCRRPTDTRSPCIMPPGSGESAAVHLLRNHLGIVVSFTDLILDSFAADDPRREDVTTIRDAANDALALIPEIAQTDRAPAPELSAANTRRIYHPPHHGV